ncbi:MAG: ThuA domain-containing protein [Akkermansiaceae bacterium]|nr:ThuA domain-containing protein [Akkermansiaceae bacterium]
MKSLVPSLAVAAVAASVIALKPAGEQAPPGSAGKIAEALPSDAYAKPQKPRRLLVYSRTNGFRHASIATGKLALAEMGKTTGAFEVEVSEDPAEFDVDRLRRYDAVCFLSTTMNAFAPRKDEWEKMSKEERDKARELGEQRQENLMKFVKSGRGFVGIHAATDTFYDWPEYGKMMNGYFDGHPWTADTPVSIKVEPGMENHPLVKMFGGENVEFKEEIYQFKDPYDSTKVDMLLRLDTEKTDMTRGGIKRKDGDFGVAWARHWSKGRMFYCSIGHNHDMYWHPKVLRHYLAGIQWALGDLEVDVKSGD